MKYIREMNMILDEETAALMQESISAALARELKKQAGEEAGEDPMADIDPSMRAFIAGVIFADLCGGSPEELNMAAQQWLEAVSQGNLYAFARLGNAYMNGLGVPKDLEKAQMLLKKAADAGNYDAIRMTGAMLLSAGEIRRAIYYFKRAHEMDYPFAAYCIGEAMLADQALSAGESMMKAHSWLKKAGDYRMGDDPSEPSGNERAAEIRKAFINSQIEKGLGEEIAIKIVDMGLEGSSEDEDCVFEAEKAALEVAKAAAAQAEKERKEAEQKQEDARRQAEKEQQEKEERQRQEWVSQGLCKFCGGLLKGMFGKKCTSCGKAQ